ncbi:aromatic amino acid aminotransferase DDB_G0287711-like [Anoplolepis gracilipes]|uniref:aromatic amino acid aminotransferase DDB_G0287711-like n=1 Tax=Anoplolepis gracilipes TaxID=354296 RepID=UPI003BA318B9
MDYTKFFSKITHRRRHNIIRQLYDIYMSHPNCVTFAGGLLNVVNTCPVEDLSITYKHDILIKLNKYELATAFQYVTSQDYKPLLEKWKEFLKTWHTSMQNDWDITLTSDTLDACNKIFEMMLDENDPILLQTPTYTGVIGALSKRQIK